MELDTKRIGERIRLLRLKQGMTQKSLAGEHMTRNMLSLIENGQAAPSLSTILYISDRLKVPAGYFFAETDEEEQRYHKMMVISEIKHLYSAGLYRECEQQIQDTVSVFNDDEIAFLSARCYLQTALQYAASYELKSASAHLKLAADAVQKTIYADENLKAAIIFYKELFSLLPNVSEFPEKLTDLRYASAFVPVEMLHYFSALRIVTKNPQLLSSRDFHHASLYDRHLYALHLMTCGQLDQAVKVLRDLINAASLPFFMRYRICCDLEEAANVTGDFKIAYNAARKKLDLIEAAKH